MVIMYAPEVNGYVISCDVNAREGRGSCAFGQKGEAKRFPSTVEAWEYWKRQSTVTPLRPDGKPNRPLTAYTVMMETI